MINHNEEQKSIVICNDNIKFEIDYNNGVQLKNIVNLLSNISFINYPEHLFVLEILDKRYTTSDLTLSGVTIAEDEVQQLISFDFLLSEWNIRARASLVSEKQESYTLLFQVGANWKDSVPQEIFIHLPLFKQMNSQNKWYLPSNPIQNKNGLSVMQLHKEFDLPLCNILPNNKDGISIELRNYPPFTDVWNQNRNVDIIQTTQIDKLLNNKMLLRIENQPLSDVFEFRFFSLTNGWEEAFSGWRERVRQDIDFSEYQREDLKWYDKILYQHFTFAYSKEVFDYETKQFNASKLVQAGKDVGGYDSVLLWFQYPRLGVDQRKQWDFNNDVPDGIEGIKRFTQECQSQGVRVFLPFKPWDIQQDETHESITENIANIVEKTGIDGIWFDTMNSVPDGFRERLDEIRPGIIFCIEGFPATTKSVETITGSWDQHFRTPNMPETFVIRYLFPENNAPVTSRWKVGESKDMLIDRAIFNGTGIAVWQDIFGAWLPFSAEQKSKLKKWKAILLDNFDVFFGSNPIPLYPSLSNNIFINKFISNDKKEEIYCVYNENTLTHQGELFRFDRPFKGCDELWSGQTIKCNEGVIFGTLKGRGIMIIKITR